MQIVRTETATGGPARTRRETIVPLIVGRGGEVEAYKDCSESEGWPWDSNPKVCTWDIQEEAFRQLLEPLGMMDSEAAEEQADGDDDKGGVYTYPFSHTFLPIGHGLDDGDLNLTNWDRKMRDFKNKYFGGQSHPVSGGTEIMSAIEAGDKHWRKEAKENPGMARNVRIRTVWTDGALNDLAAFIRYLSQAKPSKEGYGDHGEWVEVWAIAIFGEEGGGGHAAYEQYKKLAKDHPWIHVYYFEQVTNPAEIAEDMALAVVPQAAQA